MDTDQQKALDNAGHRQRVRDRFIKTDGEDFADYELLELLLMMSIPRRDVKPIAKELLRKFGSFANVIYAPRDELTQINWIKDGTFVLFRAIVASVKKICREYMYEDNGISLLTPSSLIEYCRASMAYEDVEEVRAVYLDSQLKLLADELLQKGSLTSVSISPRDIIIGALKHKASSVILIHNHPSDNVVPSDADKFITKQIFEACRLINIDLQEHIIIGKTNYFSFAEHHIIDALRQNFKN
ncbi:MAG: DNA repair protein RadC [Alphaproteobacteria bacterium]|nr:DNA repair protein RadC [Alphaproteobacteria bacterium]